MYYLYILTDKKGVLYIGYSSDLKRRLKEHRQGQVTTTSKMKEVELFYYEAYNSKDLALERERKLKQFGSSYNGLLKRLKIK